MNRNFHSCQGGVPIRSRPGRAIAVLLCALAVAGCRPLSADATTFPVVASFYPLAEFARRIGGERVTVRTLVPAGAESHDYEPTPQDVAAISRARVLVFNGAGFEPWVAKLSGELPASAVTVNATAGLPLAGGDPHVWLDPVLAQDQAAAILAGLVRADPGGRTFYQTNAARLTDELGALGRRYADRLRVCRTREFITTHAAFGYMARRYGLQQISIAGLSPGVEPSAGRLRALVHLARRHGVRVIYAETLVSPRTAETLALEIGASVRVLNPLEGMTEDELRQGKNYFTVMDENLSRLAEGLDCR